MSGSRGKVDFYLYSEVDDMLSDLNDFPVNTTAQAQFQLYLMGCPEVVWVVTFTVMLSLTFIFVCWMSALLHRHIIYRRKC